LVGLCVWGGGGGGGVVIGKKRLNERQEGG
jgi:hypothetical protein